MVFGLVSIKSVEIFIFIIIFCYTIDCLTTTAMASRLWYVNGTQSTCILAAFEAKINVNGADHIINSTVQADAKTGANYCQNDVQILSLNFSEIKELNLTFKRNESHTFVNEIIFRLNNIEYKNNSVNFISEANHSYKCVETNQLFFGAGDVYINISFVRLEAFRTKKIYNSNSDHSDQWEFPIHDCNPKNNYSIAWKITGISLGAGVGLAILIMLICLISAHHQKKILKKLELIVKVQDQQDQLQDINSKPK